MKLLISDSFLSGAIIFCIKILIICNAIGANTFSLHLLEYGGQSPINYS